MLWREEKVNSFGKIGTYSHLIFFLSLSFLQSVVHASIKEGNYVQTFLDRLSQDQCILLVHTVDMPLILTKKKVMLSSNKFSVKQFVSLSILYVIYEIYILFIENEYIYTCDNMYMTSSKFSYLDLRCKVGLGTIYKTLYSSSQIP